MELEERLKKYRLSRAEYDKISTLLARPPEGVEWALFSALWSEHCSYKSSRVHLKKLFFASKKVLESFGENAGIVDLGQGEKIAFKMESHNHPSFIEPYEGAATGVGGILRDIFTMGARPILLADYLCFGEPQAPRMRTLIRRVVEGIGGYGNCVGVPTISGQTEFHSSYNGNILVNALALGLFREGEPIVSSRAQGAGNLVVYVGAKTGRDGIHGASMASESFAEGAEGMRPTVQIGDPFFEKLLIESCLEVMAQGLVVAIQDMGAAGLTSSSFEMAAKGGVGFDLHLDRVPLREPLGPEEILLSESQERMLLIAKPECLKPLQAVFERWGLDAVAIGEVKTQTHVRLFWKNEMICDMDPQILTDQAPMYQRPYHPWQPTHRGSVAEGFLSQNPVSSLSLEAKDILKVLHSPQGCSRAPIFEQYDQRVGAKTHRDAAHSVGVVRLPDSKRWLAVVLGVRPAIMRLDAREGGKDALLYPALELAAKGFEPVAATDCLNFGNPEKPEVMSEFVAAVESLAEVSKAMDAPIISGNVSFYNETLGKNVTSTPSTGLVGIAPQDLEIPEDHFQNKGAKVWWLRWTQLEWNGSFAEDQKQNPIGHGEIHVHPTIEFIIGLQEMVRSKLVASSRVVGKYGLPYALARMSLNGMGCQVENEEVIRMGAKLWYESLYEVVIELKPEISESTQEQWIQKWNKQGVEVCSLGSVKAGGLAWGEQFVLSSTQLRESYERGWKDLSS